MKAAISYTCKTESYLLVASIMLLADVICEMASIDESYVDVTAAAAHLLSSLGGPWQSLPEHVGQMHMACQVHASPFLPC
jgi:hypothetical protein